jgi:DNA helicase-2/ATP-dependent DNA helicase PcrA
LLENNPNREQDFTCGLNSEQIEAVNTTEGPLLVLAGAGTGKTKVLTSRIANILLTRKAFPSQILAVTFTNKAAREMYSRIEGIMQGNAAGIWLGTFHSIAAKILRRHAHFVVLTADFTIIDSDDQLKLVKQILKDFNIDDKKNPARLILHLINRYKDKAYFPNKVPTSEVSTYVDGKLVTIYEEYEKRLQSLNAVDFGNLLLLNIKLFNEHPDVLLEYQNRFHYILVDEYQDTNVAQYLWLRILAQKHNNICCVGDDDQSIYGWRGAEVTNILRFDRDFSGAKIIRLERNYRSTNHILEAATHLISNNLDRHGKKLWTENKGGKKIKLSSYYDEKEEARQIAEEIINSQRSGTELSETAILVRAGHQTRSFEESLNFLRIPYRIIGGMKFYERAEIKDSIAYVRLLQNADDSLAFERIINTPKRGIGISTLQQIYHYGRSHNLSLFAAAREMVQSGVIKNKVGATLHKFFTDFAHWNQMLSTKTHWQVVETMLQESGYIDMWRTESTNEARERVENIKEFLRSLQDFTDLNEYLQHVSLVSDHDNNDSDNKVSIMTIHAAKGLEFETVFLAGWEEGIFPSQKSIDENGRAGIEEERRLAYVGITRAKKNLHICYACNRRIYGSFNATIPSRFIDELPRSSYEIVNNLQSFFSMRNSGTQIKRPLKSVEESPQSFATTQGKFRKGQMVNHSKFGGGVVINIAGEFAEVSFKDLGVKKVLVDYLNGI